MAASAKRWLFIKKLHHRYSTGFKNTPLHYKNCSIACFSCISLKTSYLLFDTNLHNCLVWTVLLEFANQSQKPSENRSSHPEGFCKKTVLRKLAKSTGKYLCQSLFFNKVAGLRPTTLFKRDSGTDVFQWNLWKFVLVSLLLTLNIILHMIQVK